MDGLRYLLETNILSALIRQPQGPVAAMLARRGYGTVCTSIVVAAELRFGARKLGSGVLTRKVDDLLASLPVLPLEVGVDQTYSEFRFQLEQAGTPIGPNDGRAWHPERARASDSSDAKRGPALCRKYRRTAQPRRHRVTADIRTQDVTTNKNCGLSPVSSQPGPGGEKSLKVHGSHRRKNGLGVIRPRRGSRPYQ